MFGDYIYRHVSNADEPSRIAFSTSLHVDGYRCSDCWISCGLPTSSLLQYDRREEAVHLWSFHLPDFVHALCCVCWNAWIGNWMFNYGCRTRWICVGWIQRQSFGHCSSVCVCAYGNLKHIRNHSWNGLAHARWEDVARWSECELLKRFYSESL